jgi:beta-glucosidase
MSSIDADNPGTVQGGDLKFVDIKQANVQVQPVIPTPLLTPSHTPERRPSDDSNDMAGKKIFLLEKPDDRARELAAKLTLEEQAC